MRNYTLARLKEMVDGLIVLHGPDARVDFRHQISFRNKQRTTQKYITGYHVYDGCSSTPVIRFELDYPRGELMTDAEVAEAETING